MLRTILNGNERAEASTALGNVEEENEAQTTTVELDHTVDEVAIGLILFREQAKLLLVDLSVAFLSCTMIVISIL
jgi:hypothetical protein